MEATDMLMNEHRLIERALDAMGAWMTTLGARSESDDKAELARFVSFIQGFADAYHHGKEEDQILYPMADARLPATAQEEMFRRFQAFEEQQTRSGEQQRLRALGDALIEAHTP